MEICATKERRLLQNQVQLGIGEKAQLYFGIGQGSDKILHTCNRLIIDLWNFGSGDLKFTREGFCLTRGFPYSLTNHRINLFFATY